MSLSDGRPLFLPDLHHLERLFKRFDMIEFKRTMDLRPSFQAKAEDRANKQHGWLTKTLTRAVAEKGWEVQTVIFTGGTIGSVKIDKFEHNLTALEVKKKCMPEHCRSTAGGPRYSFASILRSIVRKSHPGDTAWTSCHIVYV